MIDPALSLLDVARAATMRHEVVPPGVPASADWRERARPGAWNTPPQGWTALQGWGQAFAQRGAKPEIELRCMQTWAVGDAGWQCVQWQDWHAEAFAPSYADNASEPAKRTGNVVTWPAGKALHWWHKEKGLIPAGLRGVLVLIQARGPAGVLLGMGLDYWSDLGATWDNFKTNGDAAIGRIRRVTPQWRTYAMTTAAPADLLAWSA